jgi:hypothetical protein
MSLWVTRRTNIYIATSPEVRQKYTRKRPRPSTAMRVAIRPSRKLRVNRAGRRAEPEKLLRVIGPCVRSRSWRLPLARWLRPSHLRREPTRTAYVGKFAKRVFANPFVSMKRTAFFWTTATRIFTFPTTCQTLPQAVRPAAADIEGHSTAAKFSQPGQLNSKLDHFSRFSGCREASASLNHSTAISR